MPPLVHTDYLDCHGRRPENQLAGAQASARFPAIAPATRQRRAGKTIPAARHRVVKSCKSL